MSSTEVFQQVNQFWSMLDDLSQNDPEAYQRLIEKHVKEGLELSVPPEPHTCLRTEILGPETGTLFINICGWKRVPGAEDPSKPIPICGGRMETETGSAGDSHAVLDVAFSPSVLQAAGEDRGEMEQLHLLALRFARQQHGLNLSQRYSVAGRSLRGSVEDARRRLGAPQPPGRAQEPDAVPSTPASLLRQISSLRTAETEDDRSPRLILEPEVEEKNKKNLIQVLSSTAAPTAQPQSPRYRLLVNAEEGAEGVSRSVELTVELPEVRSVSQCQLSVSQDDVLLEVEDLYYLLLELPEIINEESASATFNKTDRRLTLRIEVL